MYWPLVGIVPTIQRFLAAYREVFCRDAGFEHVSRYINGLLLSANKTLQGIYAQILWPAGKQVSRRAMHEAVLESQGLVFNLLSPRRASKIVCQKLDGNECEVLRDLDEVLG